MTCSNNERKKGVAMDPVSFRTTALNGKRGYTHTYCGDILTAVRNLTKDMVTRPVKSPCGARLIRGGKRTGHNWGMK